MLNQMHLKAPPDSKDCWEVISMQFQTQEMNTF